MNPNTSSSAHVTANSLAFVRNQADLFAIAERHEMASSAAEDSVFYLDADAEVRPTETSSSAPAFHPASAEITTGKEAAAARLTFLASPKLTGIAGEFAQAPRALLASRVASRTSLVDLAAADIPRNRSATLCVDSPRNLSYTNLQSLRGADDRSSQAATPALGPSMATMTVAVMHDLLPQPAAVPATGLGVGQGYGSAAPGGGTAGGSGLTSRVPSIQASLNKLAAQQAGLTRVSSSQTALNKMADVTAVDHHQLQNPPTPMLAPPTPSIIAVMPRRNSEASAHGGGVMNPLHLPGQAFIRDKHAPQLVQPGPAQPTAAGMKKAIRNDLPVNGQRYDKCCICMDYGTVAPQSCCAMARHARCEKRYQSTHLDAMTLLPDGRVSLPCSVCKQEWMALHADDPWIIAVIRQVTIKLKNGPQTTNAEGQQVPRPPLAVAILREGFGSRAAAKRFIPYAMVVTLVGVGIWLLAITNYFLDGRAGWIILAIVSSLLCSLVIYLCTSLLRVLQSRAIEAEIAAEAENTSVTEALHVPEWAQQLALASQRKQFGALLGRFLSSVTPASSALEAMVAARQERIALNASTASGSAARSGNGDQVAQQ